jgi:hypothetical protein
MGSNPGGSLPGQQAAATSTLPAASGSSNPASAEQTQQQPTGADQASGSSKNFRGSKNDDIIDDENEMDSDDVSVTGSLKRSVENFTKMLTGSQRREKEQESMDAWEKEEMEYEREIQRNLREGIKLPARDIPKRAESIAEYRRWLKNDDEKWEKIREEKRQQSWRNRMGRFYQTKKTQVQASTLLLLGTFPTSGSALEGKFATLGNDIVSSYKGTIEGIESSISSSWNRTINTLENWAGYWDERRFFLRSAFNVESPRAIDFAKTLDLTGRTAVVTGATSGSFAVFTLSLLSILKKLDLIYSSFAGIGREVTKALAVSGAQVIGSTFVL